MIRVIRLTKENIKDLVQFTKQEGFSFPVDEKMAKDYCKGLDPTDMCVQTYGVYDDDRLISIMTASYLKVFYHPDSPKGKTVQISGAFTIPERRCRGYGKMLLDKIIEEARTYFNADYLCCDTIAPQFFGKYEFKTSSENRMWIVI